MKYPILILCLLLCTTTWAGHFKGLPLKGLPHIGSQDNLVPPNTYSHIDYDKLKELEERIEKLEDYINSRKHINIMDGE